MKSKIAETLKHAIIQSSSGEDAVTPLAGPEVAVALEALHTMFMKEVANSANMEAFKNKKSAVDNKMMVKVAKEALNNHIPEPGSDSSENSQVGHIDILFLSISF